MERDGVSTCVYGAAVLAALGALCVGLEMPAVLRCFAALGLLAASAALYLALHRVAFQSCALKELALAVPNLPPHLAGMRVAVLSDLHTNRAHSKVSSRIFAQALAYVADARPDVVFLLGDIVDSAHRDVEQLDAFLTQLAAHGPVLAVYGNHDYLDGDPASMTPFLQSRGVTVLQNGTCAHLGDALDVIGLDDMEQITANTSVLATYFATRAAERPVFVLTHNPELACTALQHPVDAVFAGHTHGGQLCTPWGVPILALLAPFRRLFWWSRVTQCRIDTIQRSRYVSGLYTGQGPSRSASVLVTRGLGCHWGLRVCCEAEVHIVTLQPTAPHPSP